MARSRGSPGFARRADREVVCPEDGGQSAGSMLGAAVARLISRRGPQPTGQSDEVAIEAALSQRGPRMSEAGMAFFARYWPSDAGAD